MLSGEQLLKQAFSETAAIKYEQVPEYRHIFSLRYRIRKHKLLRSLERKTASEPRAHTGRFRLKYFVLAIIMACVLVLTGGVIMFWADGFKGIVHSDHIRLYVSDIEGSPETIEKCCFLSVLPEGFTLEHYTTGYSMNFIVYRNNEGKDIFLIQYVKKEFDPYVNNVDVEFTETTVNGYKAIYAEHSKDGFTDSIIFWDSEDYVFEMSGSGSKEYIRELAEKNEMSGFIETE